MRFYTSRSCFFHYTLLATVSLTFVAHDSSAANTNNQTITGTVIINSGEQFNNNTLQTGADVTINPGATANTNTINNGEYKVYGQSDNNIINGGTTTLNTGSTANHSTISSGSMLVAGNASDNNLHGGNLTVNNGGIATDNKITSGNFRINGTANTNTITGGTTIVQNGGNLTNSNLSASADVTVLANGSANTTTLTAGNLLIQGTSNNTTVTGGTFIINGTSSNQGAASTNTISGGTTTVQQYGKIISSTLSNNANVTIANDGYASNTTMTGGTFKISGTSATNNISGGNVTVDGIMSNNTISNNANVTVDFGGEMASTQMSGGTLTISGDARNTSMSNGNISIEAGGYMTDSTISNNAKVSIKNGGTSDIATITGGTLTVAGNAYDTTMSGGKIIAKTQTSNLEGLEMSGNSTFDISTDAQVTSATIYNNTSSIDNNHKAINWHINNGSVLSITSGGTASDTEVQNGGTLNIANGGEATTLTVQSGGKINANSGGLINGDIIIYKNAVMSGDYGYDVIFKSGDDTVSSLSIVDGINTGFNNSLVSEGGEHNTLNLHAAEYKISNTGNNEYTKVSGWNKINVLSDSSNQASVSLKGDLNMVGNDAELYLSENALLNQTSSVSNITGSVNNKGIINLSNNTNGLGTSASSQSSYRMRPMGSGDTADNVLNISGNYTAGPNAILKINVNPTAQKADTIHIDGDVQGSTKLVLDMLSTSYTNGKIPFAYVPNDDESTASDFTVWRVLHNPYSWESEYNSYVWYLNSDGQPSPTPDPTPEKPKRYKVNPEIIAYLGLPTAGLEQSSNIFNNIRDKVAANKVTNKCCGFIEDWWRYDPKNNLWVDANYIYSKIGKNFDIESSIYGADMGYDLQANLNNKLGIFFAYRNGNYDINGEGEKYYSDITSTIEIESYLAGLYYRYDREYFWLQAIAYGGIQDVEISTDDDMNADTKGTEFGAGGEVGYAFRLINDITLEPSLGVFYTQIDYDDIDDKVGNHVEYDTVQRLAFEGGIKLEKTFRSYDGNSKVYIKPSIISQKSLSSAVRVRGLDEYDTINDRVLGRIQIGGRYGVTRSISAFGHVNYTFGDEYNAISAMLGLNYAW